MSNPAKVFARIRGYRRPANYPEGVLEFSLEYTRIDCPQASGVFTVTAPPVMNEKSLADDLKDALGAHLAVQSRHVVLAGL